MNQTPKIARQGRYLYVLTPFHEEYVDDLKRIVQSRKRQWMPESKLWRVDASEETVLIHLLLQHFGQYEFVPITDWLADDPPPPRPAQAYARLHLLPSAPPAVISAAYKALAKMNHPDHGGSTVAMQQLNEAYEQLATNEASR